MRHANDRLATSGGYDSRIPFEGLTAATHGSGELVSELFYATARALRHWLDAWRRRRAIAQTVKELSALDARLLRDIGIDRGDIRIVAKGVADHPDLRFGL